MGKTPEREHIRGPDGLASADSKQTNSDASGTSRGVDPSKGTLGSGGAELGEGSHVE